jgi:hypothetical protein
MHCPYVDRSLFAAFARGDFTPLDRLHTILSYDRICVLNNGKIAEFGVLKDLYAQGGFSPGCASARASRWKTSALLERSGLASLTFCFQSVVNNRLTRVDMLPAPTSLLLFQLLGADFRIGPWLYFAFLASIVIPSFHVLTLI